MNHTRIRLVRQLLTEPRTCVLAYLCKLETSGGSGRKRSVLPAFNPERDNVRHASIGRSPQPKRESKVRDGSERRAFQIFNCNVLRLQPVEVRFFTQKARVMSDVTGKAGQAAKKKIYVKREGIKGIISHALRYRGGKSLTFQLLRHCVLAAVPDLPVGSDLQRIATMQKRLQDQYRTLIAADPDNRLKYTYCANCPPCGVIANPPTRVCNRPNVCPWCFVRRRLKLMCKALLEVSEEKRKMLMPLCWARDFQRESDIAFFCSGTGPHVWCKATRTTQLLAPRIVNQVLGFRQLIFQLVPKDVQLAVICSKRPIRGLAARLHAAADQEAEASGLIKTLTKLKGGAWQPICLAPNVELFSALWRINSNTKQRWLRITKNEETPNDDRKP